MKTLFCLFALAAVASSLVVPQKSATLNCLMCELAVTVVEDPVDREVVAAENKFNALCKAEFGRIPFIEKECEHYGDSKLDPIIKELEGGTAPEDVCHAIKEC